MGRLWLAMTLALVLLAPALANDDCEPLNGSQAGADCQAEGSCQTAAEYGTTQRQLTGKLYLDESYTDCCGRLHIVVSSQAVMQFRQEWPAVQARLNVVNMQAPVAPAPSAGTGGASPAAAQLSPFGLEVPGLGTMSMLDIGFMDRMRAARSQAPDEFDAGFYEGWQQGALADPEGAAMAEQLIPMSEGLSVPEAMDRIEAMLDVYRRLTGGAAEQ